MTAYQPKTGQPCGCKRGLERDNCPACEGTGMRIDFAAIRARNIRALMVVNGTGDAMRNMRAAQKGVKPC